MDGPTAGQALREALGSGYFVIGTLTGGGRYLTWVETVPVQFEVPAPAPGTYESYFQLTPPPAALIPMVAEPPTWLAGPSRYFFAGVAPSDPYLTGSMPAKFHAVIYIHTTNPLRMLQH